MYIVKWLGTLRKLTRYSVSANEISFDNKISQSDCVVQLMFVLENIILPLHLMTSTSFLNAKFDYYSKYDITRETSWGSDRRNWLFSAVSVGSWTPTPPPIPIPTQPPPPPIPTPTQPPHHQPTPTPPHSPVQLKISVDKSPLNHLEVKNVFLIDHQNSLSLTPMYYSQKNNQFECLNHGYLYTICEVT